MAILCYFEEKKINTVIVAAELLDGFNELGPGKVEHARCPCLVLERSPPGNFCLAMHRSKMEETWGIRESEPSTLGFGTVCSFCGSSSAVETLGIWKNMARWSSFTKSKSRLLHRNY